MTSIASSRLGRVPAALAVLCVLMVQGCGQSAHRAVRSATPRTSGAMGAVEGAAPTLAEVLPSIQRATRKLDRACADLRRLPTLGAADGPGAEAAILRREYPKLATLSTLLATVRLPAHHRPTVVPLQKALISYRRYLSSEIQLDRRLVVNRAELAMPDFQIGITVHATNAADRQTLATRMISSVIGSPCLGELPG